MVTLKIPAIAKLIEGVWSAEEVYHRLKNHLYLSSNALKHPEAVIALIQKTKDQYAKGPESVPIGNELSRDTLDALSTAGFLSVFARTWEMIGRKR